MEDDLDGHVDLLCPCLGLIASTGLTYPVSGLLQVKKSGNRTFFQFFWMTMGKLTSIGPRLAPMGSQAIARSRIDQEADRSRQRDKTVKWRSWYKTARWRNLRMDILKRDLFTCQMPRCGRIESNTSLLVADHKTPHRGDEGLFWNPSNIWCVCKPCHDSVKQREEREAASGIRI